MSRCYHRQKTGVWPKANFQPGVCRLPERRWIIGSSYNHDKDVNKNVTNFTKQPFCTLFTCVFYFYFLCPFHSRSRTINYVKWLVLLLSGRRELFIDVTSCHMGRFPFDCKNRWEFSAKWNSTPIKARKREYLEKYYLFSENIPPGWTVPFEFSPELPKITFKW